MTIFRDVNATALLATAFANRESPRVTLHTSINGCHTLVKKSTDPLNFDDGTRSMSLPLRQQHADFIIKTRQTMQFCNNVYVRVVCDDIIRDGFNTRLSSGPPSVATFRPSGLPQVGGPLSCQG